MNTYCTFYIVRHGKSEANKNHIISGQQDPELVEEGRREALLQAENLASVPFAAAFSSDLVRAHETAKIIALKHNLAVKATKMLRERNYGSIQGQSYAAMEEALRKELDAYNALSYKERLTARIVPDMENDKELIARMVIFLRETALAYPGKNVLAVAHGNIIRTLLVHIGFGTHQELSHETIGNTGYVVIRSDGVDFEVVKTVGIEKKQG